MLPQNEPTEGYKSYGKIILRIQKILAYVIFGALIRDQFIRSQVHIAILALGIFGLGLLEIVFMRFTIAKFGVVNYDWNPMKPEWINKESSAFKKAVLRLYLRGLLFCLIGIVLGYFLVDRNL